MIRFSTRYLIACALLCLAFSTTLQAQPRRLKVLFLGNSFTATNDLPLTTANIAASMGDTLVYDSNCPGGFTLEQHASAAASLSKIAAGDWNYVVLQEQSQRPAFSDAQVADEVFPYAHQLDSMVHAQNACARSVFYMTWGYPDGDPSNCPVFPPICTYEGMDSMLHLRYMQMSSANAGIVSPVGQVFNELFRTASTLNLLMPDRMHPSAIGTYAAGLTFYTILFRKDPLLVPYTGPLAFWDANIIQHIVHDLVYMDPAKWSVDRYDPVAAFTSTISSSTVAFNSSTSKYAVHYNWSFGDGGTSTDPNPVHGYSATGLYHVRLIVDDCNRSDTFSKDITITTVDIRTPALDGGWKVYPNPAQSMLYLLPGNGMATATLHMSIRNTLGQVVQNGIVTTGAAVDISMLGTGNYFLQLSDDETGARYVLKFAKQ